MRHYTHEDIIRIAKESDIRFIRLQFTDMFGTLKNIAIMVSELEKALDGKCMFDGSSIEGFARIDESDMYLVPDLNSFEIFPWRPQQGKVARLICDVYLPDGTPFEGDPRYRLRKAVAAAAEMGYTFNVGSECEFFLFLTDENGRPTTVTHDEGSYFDLGPVDLGEDCRRDICLTLEEMGFQIEASHHENANGQHEIDFKYDQALQTADNIVTFKMVVKTIAHRHGLHATFMPKPIFGVNGSGMHTNMSLAVDGRNAFYDASDELGLSVTARQFLAGLLKHAPGLTPLTNPLVNSYKRLVPGYEAPVYITWSAGNRSPLIRVPAARGEGTRLELRFPDPTANPYLALAACLNAGLDGVRNGLTPPEAITGNIYTMTEAERAAQGIASVPGTLMDALDAMRADALVRDTLGEHIFKKYMDFKTAEWNDFRSRVTSWEIEQYLYRY